MSSAPNEPSEGPEAGESGRLAVVEPAAAQAAEQAWYYQLPLSPAQVMETLTNAPQVAALGHEAFPEFGPPTGVNEFAATLGERSFVIHRAASERGQSGTGLRASLQLEGKLHPSATGCMLELRFAYGRPGWAVQRGIGFALVLSLGSAWIFVGQAGTVMQRAAMVAIFMLFVSPLVVNDFARGRRLRTDRSELHALAERTFGALAMGRAGEGPYREG